MKLFGGTNFWEDEGLRIKVMFSAALLEDEGLLKRRALEGQTQYRATFKAYRIMLKWPGIGEVEGFTDELE